MEEKRLIRKQIFAARKQCADEQVEEWSRQLTERVIRLPEFLQADRVMAYADYNHEVMTRFIIEEAWKWQGSGSSQGGGKGHGLLPPDRFLPARSWIFRNSGAYRGETVDWTDALMIMPGVAFDRENHRVGYGGGFTTVFWRSIRILSGLQLPLISRSWIRFPQSRPISARRSL